jgi:hypothetical protein
MKSKDVKKCKKNLDISFFCCTFVVEKEYTIKTQ